MRGAMFRREILAVESHRLQRLRRRKIFALDWSCGLHKLPRRHLFGRQWGHFLRGMWSREVFKRNRFAL